MRLKRHASILDSTLRPYSLSIASKSALRPLPIVPVSLRCRYSSASACPERIAVLGGGVAGLSSAYFVSREFPKSKVTIFEAGKDIGGWIKSKKVQVDGGEVVFELGPRTLRNSTPTAHLVQSLGLVDDVTYTSKYAPAAKNRYIYYPDRLNRLPAERPSLGDMIALWQSGIFAGALGVLREPWVPRRQDALDDETIGSFLERRVDKRVANNIVSAVFHGIYAGDIWQLSAKTLLSLGWQLEGRYGSALGGFTRMQSEDPRPGQFILAHPYDVDTARAINDEIDLDLEFAQKLLDSSTFTFKNGLQQLVEALKSAVEKTGNVDVRTESPVLDTKLVEDEEGLQVAVNTGNEPSTTTENFDLVISTLRQPSLTPYVTVMTVNLFYPATASPSISIPDGFGYLLPQSIPFTQNPERALGVIFDSSATSGQDSVPGTKLTVMMGGHWWDGWTAYPDEAEGLEMAKAVVQRHLNITAEPSAHFVNLSRECIPQYTLGYEERLREFANGMENEFKGRLRVVGNQFNGVGVNDCVTGAWNLARGLRDGGWKNRNCGLERVQDAREWRVMHVGEMGYRTKGPR